MHFFQTILHRREPTDLVAYWVLVHDEANLKLLTSTAPFKGTNMEWEKEEWVKEYADKIKQAYITRKNRPPVIKLWQNSCNSLTMHFLLNFSRNAATGRWPSPWRGSTRTGSGAPTTRPPSTKRKRRVLNTNCENFAGIQ